MKKILFASTALILSAGVASANDNISFSGDARMGVVYSSAAFGDANTSNARFSARARMTISMSRTTDTGLTVGATFRVAQGGAAESGNLNMSGGTVFISGDFGRLTMGDIAGAVDGAVGNLPNIGFSELRAGTQYLSNTNDASTPSVYGRTAARYEYSFDGFTVMLSSDQLSGSGQPGMASIGARYTFDGFTIAAGYETGRQVAATLGGGVGDRVEHWMIGAEAAIDMVTLKAVYGQARNRTMATNFDQWGLSASANIDAVNVTAYYMKRLDTSRNYGIGASYNLGGGAHLRGGVNRSGTTTTADFGVTMSF